MPPSTSRPASAHRPCGSVRHATTTTTATTPNAADARKQSRTQRHGICIYKVRVHAIEHTYGTANTCFVAGLCIFVGVCVCVRICICMHVLVTRARARTFLRVGRQHATHARQSPSRRQELSIDFLVCVCVYVWCVLTYLTQMGSKNDTTMMTTLTTATWTRTW